RHDDVVQCEQIHRMVGPVADSYGQPLAARDEDSLGGAEPLCWHGSRRQLEMVTEGVLKLPSRCSRQRCFGDRSWRRDLSVGGLTADQRDRDMPHRRIRFGAMPMAFTSLDMDDVADIDLALILLCRHHP